MNYQILHGDVLDMLATLPDESVNCCVTSPPYWGLRDYGVEGQIGLESTPEEFTAKMVEVFRVVRRVLRNDGTLWLNIGDSYATGAGGVGECPGGGKQGESWRMRGVMTPPNRLKLPGLKPKDLCGIPWRMAFALQADGWYLRQDIIWAKPNPMPESVRDRCTKAHEYIFLLSKSERYYYDQDAVREPYVSSDEQRESAGWVQGWAAGDGPRTAVNHAVPKSHNGSKFTKGKTAVPHDNVGQGDRKDNPIGRNRRSVWAIPSEPFPEAHFATFPTELVRPCIMAGCPEGGTVLDPFNGSGTTGVVSLRLGRNYVGIDLNADYIAMSHRRIQGDRPLFNTPIEVTA